MLRALEGIVCDAADVRDRVLAGGLVFTTLARDRVGDLRRVAVLPFLDDLAGDNSGFVETAMVGHKTARPGCKRAMAVVAPALGVSGAPWAA